MSEKRFVLCKKGDVEYIEDNGCVQLYGFDVLCEMLNEFNDENKELKSEIEQSDLISEDIVCADIQHQLLKVTDENKELKKENEQLKQKIQRWKNLYDIKVIVRIAYTLTKTLIMNTATKDTQDTKH